jgi:hypothetical protein
VRPHSHRRHLRHHDPAHHDRQRQVLPEPLAHPLDVDVEHHHDEQEQHHHRADVDEEQRDREELRAQSSQIAEAVKNASTRNSAALHRVRAVITHRPATSSTVAKA